MSAPRTSFLRPEASDRYGSYPSSPIAFGGHDGGSNGGGDPYGKPTYATFSPATALSAATNASSAAKRRSTILIHQKSPLLLATPPQITRSLAYSHPFILPLNKLAGLLSWTSGDPWESFVLVLLWWGTVLYGDTIIRFAGPIVLVLVLIAGMYGRRYSPLSTSGWVNEDTSGDDSDQSSRSGGGSGLGYFLFGIGGGGSGTSATPAKASRNATPAKSRSRAKNLSVDTADFGPLGAGKGGGRGSGSDGGGHQRTVSEIVTNTRHQKTLDEIVETLKEFTARCNLLLEPLLELTDFLSTQSTPTSATTRPALTTLFIRILLCTPFWYLLTLPPLRIVTTRRVALVFGTVILTWHSRVMRVSRTILWRSATVRRTTALVTGLAFEGPMKPTKTPSYVTAGGSGGSDLSSGSSTTPAAAAAALQSKLTGTKTVPRLSTPRESELTKAIRRARSGHDAGVRFTFILYENQRRWVGLGWTTNLMAYERPPWTDEHNNAVPTKDEFELPEVEDGSKMRWRWVEASRWRVDGVMDDAVRVEKTGPGGEHKDSWDYDGEGGRMGWVYYDNKWQNGRRGQDGWNRWTRRRKWYRDAELVEVDVEDETESTSNDRADTPTPTSSQQAGAAQLPPGSPGPLQTEHTVSTAYVSAPPMSGGGMDGGADRKSDSLSMATGTGTSMGGTDADADAETASLLSTSSRSVRSKAPSLRRRVTDASGGRGVAAPAVTTNATATAIPISALSHLRRDSDVNEEEEAALSSSAGVKLHEAGNDPWGIGDEARMGLD